MLNMYTPRTSGNDWNRLQKRCIVNNSDRNGRFVDVICPLVKEGYKVLGLVNILKHGVSVASWCSEKLDPLEVYFYRGSSKLEVFRGGKKVRQQTIPIYDLADQLEGEPEYCLFGSPAVKEDVDFPATNVLCNLAAMRSLRGTVQKTGRVLRAKQGSNIAHVIDAWDKMSFVLTHQSRTRKRTYEERYSAADKYRFYEHSSPDEVVSTILSS